MTDYSKDITNFTQELVRTPSQNGLDSERDVAELVINKLEGFGFHTEVVGEPFRPSVICSIGNHQEEKTIWLQACLDTVTAGSLAEWEHDPFEAEIVDGKMFGRGVADCKVAIAIFCYLAESLAKDPDFKANLFLGFDADEQSGCFTGIREILNHAPKADVCILGYQGMKEISIGARGWSRMTLSTIGEAYHTGARSKKGKNAIHAMGKALVEIPDLKLHAKKDPFFEFGSAINVSLIEGGSAINVVPDLCRAEIDTRLVPGQTAEVVERELRAVLDKIAKKDADFVYRLEVGQGEPAYITRASHPFVKLLQRVASEELGQEVPLVASGQGSVGNIVSALGVPIINAFGCASGNAHAPNEWIDVTTIQDVFEIYRKTVLQFVND